MKNNKRIMGVLVLAIVMLTGCINDAPTSNTKAEKVFLIEDYNIHFSFPKDWEKVTTETPFDLQCTNGKSYASIFVYDKIDLAEGQTPLDIYEIQNEDILSKRENVKIVSEEKVDDVENKRIHSILYSAERDGVKNYYYCNLIEFKEDADVFVWVLFTAAPSYSEANIAVWKTITASANRTKE